MFFSNIVFNTQYGKGTCPQQNLRPLAFVPKRLFQFWSNTNTKTVVSGNEINDSVIERDVLDDFVVG